jgi:uncharacterized protein YkwD
MATRYIPVSVLVVALAVIAAFCALVLVPRGSNAAPIYVKTCSGGTIELDANEKRLLDLHNTARHNHGLKRLCVHPALTAAARAHSHEMLSRDYLSHRSYNGETTAQRLARYGYTLNGYSYYALGENIAWGCGSAGTPDKAFSFWMHSRDHRHNILNKKFREIGIGSETGTYKTCTQATVHTVDFGVRIR